MKVSSVEKLHSDIYPVALQVAKKFADGKHSLRPVLTYVNHEAQGDIVATDSHRMIRIKNVHGFKEPLMVNPSSFEIAQGDYPDTSSAIPKEDKQPTITLNQDNLKIWFNAHKTLMSIAKVTKEDRIGIEFEEELRFIAGGKVEMKLPCQIYAKDNAGIERIHYDVEYMTDALEALMKLNSKKAEIRFFGQYSPITLDNTENVTVLILPIRVY